MDQDDLREHLAKLRAQLTDARANPDHERNLHDAMEDIHRIIEEPAESAASADPSLPDRLEKIAVQFEADHPKLAAGARRLVELLAEVGI